MYVHPSYNLLLTLAVVQLAHVSAERVLGAYIYSRHGDRSAKVLGNTHLTDLGYLEVFQSGNFYHDRYISPGSSLQIEGISHPKVDLQQVYASATADDIVIDNSAAGFLQGLYPPVGSSANQTLRNGETVHSPLNGFQLIPLSPILTGSNSENTPWLEGASGCKKAEISSNEFFSSSIYHELEDSTKSFYQSLSPILSHAFNESQMSFKNAYVLFDYINVAEIHNSTESTPLKGLTSSDMAQLLQLANVHEWYLSYNKSEKIRAVAGSVLAGAVLEGLNKTITTQGKSKLGVQVGPYSTFLSYFGLSQMTSLSPYFEGMPLYASTMAWELVTSSTTGGFPPASDISVRFLFHNGSISASDGKLTAYPLFGRSDILTPWSEFVDETNKIAIVGTDQWCEECGNTDGQCAEIALAHSGTGSGSKSTQSSSNKLTLGQAGVIGAMVTLAVIVGLEILFLVLGGFRLRKKGDLLSGSLEMDGGKL